MRISAVVVCHEYSDFLAETLPLNKNQFEEIVVVTSKGDKRTQKVCEDNYVKCIQTDVFFEDDAPFNKAKGINVGLKHLKSDTWHLHLDADIFVGHLFKRIMDSIELDKETVYGCDRFMIHSYEEWVEQKNNPFIVNENGIYLHPWHSKVPLGTRIWRINDGYIPIGFFQLWNPQGSGITTYPDKHKDAARSDMQFTLQWPRAKRSHLGEIIVWHLESERPEKMGKNWDGRVIGKKGTKHFGPSLIYNELQNIEDELEEVEDELEDVEEALVYVEDSVQELDTDIDDLKVEVSDLKNSFVDFQKDIKNTLADILEEIGKGNTYKAQSVHVTSKLDSNEFIKAWQEQFQKAITRYKVNTSTGPAVVVPEEVPQEAPVETPVVVVEEEVEEPRTIETGGGFSFLNIFDKFRIPPKGF